MGTPRPCTFLLFGEDVGIIVDRGVEYTTTEGNKVNIEVIEVTVPVTEEGDDNDETE